MQKLFFEEMQNGGDPNAAAAAALMRLTEISRPAGDNLEPMRTMQKRQQSLAGRFGGECREPHSKAGAEVELQVEEADDLSRSDRLVVMPI